MDGGGGLAARDRAVRREAVREEARLAQGKCRYLVRWVVGSLVERCCRRRLRTPSLHPFWTTEGEGSFPSEPPRRHGVARLARSRCATTAPATSKTSARASATAAEGQLATVAVSQCSSRRRTTAATTRGRRQSIALRRPSCRGDSAGGSSPSSPLIRRPRPVTARSARAVLSRAVLGCFSCCSARVLLGSLAKLCCGREGGRW